MNHKKVTAKMISLMSRQSLKSSRMRNTFVMVTIVLASSLLTAILMFAMGQKQETKNELSHRQQAGYYNLTAEQVEALKKDERIACQIQVKTGILSEMDGFDVKPYYVSELSDQIRIGELESGRLPEKENEIAVQAQMLKKLNISPAAGSSVTLTFYDGSTETFTVSGILKGSDTAKQFSVLFSKSYAEKGSQLKSMPWEVYTKLYNATNMRADEFTDAVYLIAKDTGIERKYAVPSKAFTDSLSIDTQFVMLYSLVGAVILLACILVIYGVFYLSVIGRIHQFGQLRTIGMTKKQMKKFVSREGRMLFSRSAPIGIAIGGIAGYLMIPNGFNILNTLLIIALVFIIIYIITIISVKKPAKIASAVSPMEALRYMPQSSMKKASNKKLCRRLTPFNLGMMNFSKNQKKAVITMCSLALGGILFMTAATYMSSFDKKQFARQGDFADAEFVISISNGAIELNEHGISGIQADNPMNQEMMNRIADLNGVKEITAYENLGIKFDAPSHDEYGTDDKIALFDKAQINGLDQYLEEGSTDYDRLISGDYILVTGSGTMEEIYGWHFQAGDKLLIHYFDGEKMAEKELTVLGVLSDAFYYANHGYEGWFIMPDTVADTMVSYESLNTKLCISTKPEQEAAIGEALQSIIEAEPELTMETLAERAVLYEANASQLLGAIIGLSAFIMMFSILSMMNTLITNIVTRKQELAMLESIGMGKSQIRQMLLGESLLLVITTVGVTMTIGTLCGYSLSHTLYQMGIHYMVFRFPAALALVYAGVLILVPFLITLTAMKSFSKEILVERLRGMEN